MACENYYYWHGVKFCTSNLGNNISYAEPYSEIEGIRKADVPEEYRGETFYIDSDAWNRQELAALRRWQKATCPISSTDRFDNKTPQLELDLEAHCRTSAKNSLLKSAIAHIKRILQFNHRGNFRPRFYEQPLSTPEFEAINRRLSLIGELIAELANDHRYKDKVKQLMEQRNELKKHTCIFLPRGSTDTIYIHGVWGLAIDGGYHYNLDIYDGGSEDCSRSRITHPSSVCEQLYVGGEVMMAYVENNVRHTSSFEADKIVPLAQNYIKLAAQCGVSKEQVEKVNWKIIKSRPSLLKRLGKHVAYELKLFFTRKR